MHRYVTHNHSGNAYFRSLVNEVKMECFNAPKHRKALYAEYIVNKIKSLNPPGRFLKYEKKAWVEISDKEAMLKTRQALREVKRTMKKKDANERSTRASADEEAEVSCEVNLEGFDGLIINISQT